jgi:DNA-binding PucR family transcriptional regulator
MATVKQAVAFAKRLADELRGYADTIAVDRLERAIATNSLFLIEQAINFAQLDRVLERLVKPELHEGFLDGAKVGVKELAKVEASIDFKGGG